FYKYADPRGSLCGQCTGGGRPDPGDSVHIGTPAEYSGKYLCGTGSASHPKHPFRFYHDPEWTDLLLFSDRGEYCNLCAALPAFQDRTWGSDSGSGVKRSYEREGSQCDHTVEFYGNISGSHHRWKPDFLFFEADQL